MIDKTDPEIQKYVQEELQKQKEQIAERMIWRSINVPYFGSTYYENVVYYVGLSRETINKIATNADGNGTIRMDIRKALCLLT